jgi:serine/threonine protein kinase
MTTTTEWICIKCGNEVDKDSERCPVCGATKDPLQGKILAGKYRLVKKLAEGGMGYVYQAEHTRLKHQNRRAIKILKEDVLRTPSLCKRFLREVELTHKLSQSNPHIVSIYDDYGFKDGIGYYVMEFLEGLSLERYITQQPGSLSLSWVVNIAIQICDGLHTVHEEQIVHRDLKPANIFVVKDAQNQDFVKLIDFGVAKADAISTQHTAQGAILGTLLYIAPEQINTNMLENLDGRCDIYALGCIMYEMLTGQLFLPPPEKMDTAGAIQYMAARMTTEPPPPSSKRNEIPPLLDAITLKMLAKIPEHRYQTVTELSTDLHLVAEQFRQDPIRANEREPVQQNNLERPKQAMSEQLLPSGTHSYALYPSSGELPSYSLEDDKTIVKYKSENYTNTPIFQAPSLTDDDTIVIYEASQEIVEDESLQWVNLRHSVKAPAKKRFAALWISSMILIFLAVGIMLWIGYQFYKFQPPEILSPPRAAPPQVADVKPPLEYQIIPSPLSVKSLPQVTVIEPRSNGGRSAVSDPSLKRDVKKFVPKVSKSQSAAKKPESPSNKIAAHIPRRASQESTKSKYDKQSDKSYALTKPMHIRQDIKKAEHKTVAGCPPDRTGFYWVHLQVSPARIGGSLRFLRGKGSVHRVSTGFCISLKSSNQIQITATGYQPCTLILPANAATLSIKMQKEVLDDIFDGSKDYCLQTK